MTRYNTAIHDFRVAGRARHAALARAALTHAVNFLQSVLVPK
jgi:hypothetical protein